ncbi:3-keto-5-aminohexanoate cleavage protein [Streptomyces sp. NPDC002054]|uniref:3-keto-5-aminohexanoate cleavage protein n=1 Tax=Streptomyces sp. NPDC002054 TaxID=3154663 RepID=UPI00332D1EF1
MQVSLNGSRTAADGAAVPMSPEALVAAAVGAVAAGAAEILVHPRTPCGRESLSPRVAGPLLAALRAAVAVPLSVCATVPGEPDPVGRIRAWELLPDRATVDLADPAAAAVAAALAERGVSVDGVLRPGPGAGPAPAVPVARLVVELAAADPALLRGLSLPGAGRTVLYGRGAAAWPVLRMAVALGHTCRTGIGDVLHLPNGLPARSNADLVSAAALERA